MGKGVARVFEDKAGGTIIEPKAPTVFVNGKPITVIQAAVKPHGEDPHMTAVMVECSGTVFAENQGVCREGDKASCGHPATGSSDVFAGD